MEEIKKMNELDTAMDDELQVVDVEEELDFGGAGGAGCGGFCWN